MTRRMSIHWLALASTLAIAFAYGCGSSGSSGSGGSGGMTEGGAGSAGTGATGGMGTGGNAGSGAGGTSAGGSGAGGSGAGGTSAGGSAGAGAGGTGGSATCGNGTLDPGEQCDDGNTKNLDGCDSTCHYEAMLRMTQAAISSGQAPAACTPRTNYLGTHVLGNTVPVVGSVLNLINTPLQTTIDTGKTNVLVQALNLNNENALDGVSGTGISLGDMAGALDPNKGTWTGSSPTNQPIDWWFKVISGVNSSGRPSQLLNNVTLTNHKLTAGPGTITVTLNIAGANAALTMQKARVFGTFGSATDKPASPPKANQLTSNFTAFETFTATNNGTQGICGNVTVASLAVIPLPVPTNGGADIGKLCGYTDCQTGQSPTNTTCNSLLDLMVGGCTVVTVQAIPASQPDVKNGGPTLTPGTGKKIPASQTNGDTDAYSAYLTFAGNRAHATNNL